MTERERKSPRQAVGLRYDRGSEEAPRVVARGKELVAERMVAVAREHGIPVQEDPDLVQLLAATEVGEEIPVEVYGVVATLLAFLYRLNGEAGESGGAPPDGRAT